MIAALGRRLRALPLRTGPAMLARRGRIAWSTQCLLSAGGRARIGHGSVVHGGGLIVALAGATLEVGERSTVMRGSEITMGRDSTIRIGHDCYIGSFANLRADGEVRIGDRVLVAQFVSILSGQYEFRTNRLPAAELGTIRSVTVVGDGAWIGANAVVLPGVTVGPGAVVGAGSVVTHDVPAFAIVAGNPARVIGAREPEKSA